MLLNRQNPEQAKRFIKELSNLLKAGLSLHVAIDILLQDCKDSSIKLSIQKIRTKLHQGLPFQQCLPLLLPAQFPAHFSSITILPNLEQFLHHIEHYLDKKIARSQSLIKQLTYPTILLISLMILTLGFVTIIAPTYLQFFESSGLNTPKSIQIFQTIAKSLTQFGPWIATVLAVPFLIPTVRKKALSPIYVWLGLDNPGEILWILGILLDNGIPLIKSIHCLNLSPSSPNYQKYNHLIDETKRTGSLCTGIEASALLSKKYLALLSNAEKTNRLSTYLLYVGEEMLEAEHQKIEKLTTFIQPLLLALIGLLITLFTYISFVPIVQSLQSM